MLYRSCFCIGDDNFFPCFVYLKKTSLFVLSLVHIACSERGVCVMCVIALLAQLSRHEVFNC
jgi:hypothetical protein